jgi:hypothetical protein
MPSAAPPTKNGDAGIRTTSMIMGGIAALMVLGVLIMVVTFADRYPSETERVSLVDWLEARGYDDVEVTKDAPCGDSGIRFKARKPLSLCCGTETELVEGVACGKEKTVLEWFVLVETPAEEK